MPPGYPFSSQWGCRRLVCVSPPPSPNNMFEGPDRWGQGGAPPIFWCSCRVETSWLTGGKHSVHSAVSAPRLCVAVRLVNVKPPAHLQPTTISCIRITWWLWVGLPTNIHMVMCGINGTTGVGGWVGEGGGVETAHWRFYLTVLPWSGRAEYKMLGLNVIAASLTNQFPCPWLFSISFPPNRDGATTNAITGVAQH